MEISRRFFELPKAFVNKPLEKNVPKFVNCLAKNVIVSSFFPARARQRFRDKPHPTYQTRILEYRAANVETGAGRPGKRAITGQLKLTEQKKLLKKQQMLTPLCRRLIATSFLPGRSGSTAWGAYLGVVPELFSNTYSPKTERCLLPKSPRSGIMGFTCAC